MTHVGAIWGAIWLIGAAFALLVNLVEFAAIGLSGRISREESEPF